jgi:tocopherol cyclase
MLSPMDKRRFPGRRPPLKDEGYSGPSRPTPYFEGWYLRQVSADRQVSLAVIVGISLSPEDTHAFIQLLAGPGRDVLKARYPLSDLTARRDRFDVRLGENRFTPEGLGLNFSADGVKVEGQLTFSERISYPTSILSPGIMGPYSWAPFMECIHGVISLHHRVEGLVDWNGNPYNFTGGRGYIEKDRGRSMPRQWIWMQTNEFDDEGSGLMLSVARIPWMGSSFTGHLGYLRYNGELWKIGTYAGTRVAGHAGEGDMELRITRNQRTLELWVKHEQQGGVLDAPVNGAMSREIIESPHSVVQAVLRDEGSLVWEGRAEPAAVEAAGDVTSLLTSQSGRSSKPSSSRE